VTPGPPTPARTAGARTPRALAQSLINTVCGAVPRIAAWRVLNAAARRIPSQQAALRVPGVQVCVAAPGCGAKCWSQGQANAAAGGAISARTRWRVGSLSKPVAALVALAAHDQGLMDLDEPLGPDLARLVSEAPGWAQAVTPRMLIQHAAGLECRHAPHVGPDLKPTLEDMLAGRLGAQYTPKFVREGAQTYSGAAYALLQWAIERATGTPFAALARTLIFGPLGVENCDFDRAHRFGEDVCAEHDADGRPLPRVWTPALAASGLCTSLAALAELFIAAWEVSRGLRRGPWCQKSAQLIFAAETGRFTHGLYITPRGTLSHGCHRPGIRAVLLVIPHSGLVVVMAGNADAASGILKPLSGLVDSIADPTGTRAATGG
jgi:CubicO group peptidase (beta-lactamase class C family)